MSDIPVGSPPVPPGRHAAPGGWYPDPVDPAQERYWDGWQWSRNTRINESRVPDSPPGGARPAPQQSPQQPQNPYGQNPYGQNPQGQNPYGQNPQGQAPYGQYPQNPYPQNPYGAQGLTGKAPVLTADGIRVSGWWWRVLAAIIDFIIVSLLVVIPALPIYRRMFALLGDVLQRSLDAARAGQPAPATPTAADLMSSGDQVLLGFITVAVGLIYHVLFIRLRGATPGKMAAGIRVVPVDEGRNRAPLPWSRVIIRAAIWVLPGAVAYLVIFQVLDALFPLREPRKLAIHDLVARTQVIRVR